MAQQARAESSLVEAVAGDHAPTDEKNGHCGEQRAAEIVIRWRRVENHFQEYAKQRVDDECEYPAADESEAETDEGEMFKAIDHDSVVCI